MNAWACSNDSVGISGSGLTTNYVTKWNGSAIANSQIFDTGTGVGIGTASPAASLDVNGTSIFRNTLLITANKSINFTSPGIGSTSPGGFQWLLATDNAAMYAVENASDNTDYVFKLDDNATDGGDRYVFWNTSWQGIANDRWPLMMNGTWAAFDPRFSGNVSTGSMTSATMYMDYVNRRVGVKTLTPLADFHVSGSVRLDVGSDATGDIHYRDSTGNLVRLGIGSSSQILSVA